ncbi:MAG: ribosomal protein S18-alanine N-acetyltransferase [Oscillospiraceae bacterium]
MNYTIKDVENRHIDDIMEIEKLCFSLPWSRTLLEKQMNFEECVFIAAVDGEERVLGYVGLTFVLDEGYISNVAVSPKFRRQGVAAALIGELIARTRKSLAFLTLEVRESNAPAIALYSGFGFKPVGLRRDYYEKPKENALLMTLFMSGEDTKKC